MKLADVRPLVEYIPHLFVLNMWSFSSNSFIVSIGQKLDRVQLNTSLIRHETNVIKNSLFLMFLACPGLNGFWEGIFRTLSRIWGIPIAPCPFIAISGVVLCKSNPHKSQFSLIGFCTVLV